MTTRWKLEKMYTRLRASEASEPIFLYLRWKHTILLKSQYIHCWLITVCRYNMSMTVFVTLVIWSCSLETRNLRKIISSEPKYLYFCVGKMFYIPTRNSRKSYKWLRFASKPFFLCVSETCDSSQYCVGESHSLSVQCVLMFVTLVIWSCSWRFIPTRNSRKTH